MFAVSCRQSNILTYIVQFHCYFEDTFQHTLTASDQLVPFPSDAQCRSGRAAFDEMVPDVARVHCYGAVPVLDD